MKKKKNITYCIDCKHRTKGDLCTSRKRYKLDYIDKTRRLVGLKKCAIRNHGDCDDFTPKNTKQRQEIEEKEKTRREKNKKANSTILKSLGLVLAVCIGFIINKVVSIIVMFVILVYLRYKEKNKQKGGLIMKLRSGKSR